MPVQTRASFIMVENAKTAAAIILFLTDWRVDRQSIAFIKKAPRANLQQFTADCRCEVRCVVECEPWVHARSRRHRVRAGQDLECTFADSTLFEYTYE